MKKFISFDEDAVNKEIVVHNYKDEKLGVIYLKEDWKNKRWVFEPDENIFFTSECLNLIKKKLEELDTKSLKTGQLSLKEFGIKAGVNVEKDLKAMKKLACVMAGASVGFQVTKNMLKALDD